MAVTLALALFALGSNAYNIYCDSQSYRALPNPKWPVTDAWCQATCNQFVGLPSSSCPHDSCQCGVSGEQPTTSYCTSPRSCPFNKYAPNPGTTTDNSPWCTNNCNPPVGTTRNCPCTMCLCGDPCGPGQTLTKLSFDEFSQYNQRLVRLYKGFNFQNLYVMHPKNVLPVSGYNNSIKTPPMVGFNGYARPVTIKEVDGKEFTWVSTSFTAAWQKGLTVTVIGRRNGSEVFRWEEKTCTECHVTPENSTYPAPVFPKVDEVTIVTTAGTEDPAYPRGSGAHVSMENMLICAPRHEERDILEKRSVEEEAGDDVASDGPMKDTL